MAVGSLVHLPNCNLKMTLIRFTLLGLENAWEKMSMIKDRNGMDLTEAEDIKKRWQEYTELYQKKVFITWITTMMWSLT